MYVDCKSIAAEIDQATRERVGSLANRGIKLRVIEIVATENQGVISYSNTKKRKAAGLGIDYEARVYAKDIDTASLVADVGRLNADPSVHGIIIGLPLFDHIDEEAITNAIDYRKDVDGLSAFNTFYLAVNREDAGLVPATARAAIHILERLGALSGKRVLVIGRGPTVGRPAAQMLINRNATVTIAHSKTKDIAGLFRTSEIVVSATGRPGLVMPDWIAEGQIIVDCGIAFADGKTVGDIDSAAADARKAIVTPVPGGVGVVTNAVLFSNLLKAIRLQGLAND